MEVKKAAMTVLGYKMGEMVSLMIHIGDRLDLWSALAASNWTTTAELASVTSLHPRWVMEWLRGVTAARLTEYSAGTDSTERFRLSESMAAVLARDSDSVMNNSGMFASVRAPQVSDSLVSAFRTGLGTSYRDTALMIGEEAAIATKRLLAFWTKTALVPLVLPALGTGAELITMLERGGGKVLDMGCGAGVAANTIAAAYPRCTVLGVDPDVVALGVARRDADELGVSNVEYSAAKGEEIGADASYDLALCLDIVHDVPFPGQILATVFRALKPGGILLIKDIKSTGSFPQNLKKIKMLAMLYGFSLSGCLSSAMSEPGGAGLGTVGFSPVVAARMCKEAGFVSYKMRDFKDPTNLYYEMRKPPGANFNCITARPAASELSAATSGRAEGSAETTIVPDLSHNPAPLFCGCAAAAYCASDDHEAKL